MSNIHDRASGSLAPSSSESRGSPADTPPASECPSVAGSPAADPLSDVLRAVRLTGGLFFLWHPSWPYVTSVPAGSGFAPIILPGAQQIISYHIVLEGSAWAALPGRTPVRFEAGDILLIPQGHAYVMSSSASSCARAKVELEAALDFFRRMSAGDLPFVVEDGGGGDVSTLVACGFLGCDDRPFNPVLGALPPLVRLRSRTGQGQDRMRGLVELALDESRAPRPGSRTLLLRLSELLFVEVVRQCLTDSSITESGWLRALRDPIAGRALVLLHKHPARAWTLETLASAVGISRSQLADRFANCVGEPPMQYLARWRIQLATRLLTDHPMKIAAVAAEVGYGSEAAFSRAFKRCVGVSPAQWRRRVMP